MYILICVFGSCDLLLTGEYSNVIVSQIAIPILLARCRAILHHFAETEKKVGMFSTPCIKYICHTRLYVV
jgi:hypothetical protein